MASTKLEILTPQDMFYSGEVESLTVQTLSRICSIPVKSKV